MREELRQLLTTLRLNGIAEVLDRIADVAQSVQLTYCPLPKPPSRRSRKAVQSKFGEA